LRDAQRRLVHVAVLEELLDQDGQVLCLLSIFMP